MKAKKLFSVIMILAVVMSLFTVINFSSVRAASRTAIKDLKANKTYSLDLNGGAKETVKIVTAKDNSNICVYVNGKKTCTLQDTSNIEYSPRCSLNTIKYLDLNTSDKYKELLIGYCGFNNDPYTVMIRYYNASKTKVYRANFWSSLANTDYKYVKNTGSNKIYMYVESPFWNENFGNNWVFMPAKISGQKIVIINQSSYKMNNLFNRSYVLKKSMKLYSKASKSSQVATLKKGTAFEPIRIKPGKIHTFSTGSSILKKYDLFVKVKTDTGKNGWLFFPAFASDSRGDYLVNKPAWG